MDAAMNGATYNTALGHLALSALTLGGSNTAIGKGAGMLMTANDNNVIVGYNAMSSADGGEDQNTVVGRSAGGSIDATGSDHNVIIGDAAGTGGDAAISNCVIIGSAAMNSTIDNAQDGTVAIGRSALTALTSGAGNVAVGYTAMATNKLGASNIAIGHGAMDLSYIDDTQDALTNNNIFIGLSSGGGDWATASSNHNVAIGNETMDGILNGALGNACIGYDTLGALTSGDYNTALGHVAGNATTSGIKNTSIGSYSNVSAAVDNQIAIGYSTVVTAQYGIAIGDDISAGTNDAVMGKNGAIITVDFDADGTWAQSSDIRKKRNIKDDSLGLSFINDLKTKTFQWKPAEEHPDEWGHFKVDEDGNKVYVDVNTDVVMHGMIAQDIKQALDNADCDTFAGWKERKDGSQVMSREMFVMPLIKAVQELSAQVEELKNKLGE